MGISAVSATFFWIFFGFWVDFGSCFKSFMDYSSTRACLLCYQPMAIVHYANLVLLNKYTFLTEGRYARPGHRWRTRTLLQAHSETVYILLELCPRNAETLLQGRRSEEKRAMDGAFRRFRQTYKP